MVDRFLVAKEDSIRRHSDGVAATRNQRGSLHVLTGLVKNRVASYEALLLLHQADAEALRVTSRAAFKQLREAKREAHLSPMRPGTATTTQGPLELELPLGSTHIFLSNQVSDTPL